MSLEKDNTPKQRRERITYTQTQLDLLEKVFEQSKYPDPPVCEWLISELGISDSRLQTWFRNKRAKWRQRIKDSDPNSEIDLYNSKAKSRNKEPKVAIVTENLSLTSESNSSEDSSNSQCLESLKSCKNDFLKTNDAVLPDLSNSSFHGYNQMSLVSDFKSDFNNNNNTDFDYFLDLPPMISPFSSVTEVKLDEIESIGRSNNLEDSCPPAKKIRTHVVNQKLDYFDNTNMKDDFHLLSSYYSEYGTIDMNYGL